MYPVSNNVEIKSMATLLSLLTRVARVSLVDQAWSSLLHL
jgi:hypothetical protein